MKTKEITKGFILGHVIDLIDEFLYYGRKNDEELPGGEIEKAIINNMVTLKELVDEFERGMIDGIRQTYPDYTPSTMIDEKKNV